MASAKKAVIVFTACKGSDMAKEGTPALDKLVRKGMYFSHVAPVTGDAKTTAGAGAPQGQPLWEAATEHGLTVAGLEQEFDLCVLDAGDSAAAVEEILARVFDVIPRSALLVVVAGDALFFYGMGIAKGIVEDAEISLTCVAPTVAYLADFPLPLSCRGAVAYAALKDINYKLTEIRKLEDSIKNMEAAMERQSRKPWDKHDCA